MSTAADCVRRVCWIVLLVALHVAPQATAQQRVIPQPALLPHHSPLCDSNLVSCLDIDESCGTASRRRTNLRPRRDHNRSGALYDRRGGFATGQAAAQLGIYLPFFRALKLYGEALGLSWPTYVKTTDDGITPVLAALLSPDGVDALHKQSARGLGLRFRPQARVDFGVSVQFGMGVLRHPLCWFAGSC